MQARSKPFATTINIGMRTFNANRDKTAGHTSYIMTVALIKKIGSKRHALCVSWFGVGYGGNRHCRGIFAGSSNHAFPAFGCLVFLPFIAPTGSLAAFTPAFRHLTAQLERNRLHCPPRQDCSGMRDGNKLCHLLVYHRTTCPARRDRACRHALFRRLHRDKAGTESLTPRHITYGVIAAAHKEYGPLANGQQRRQCHKPAQWFHR